MLLCFLQGKQLLETVAACTSRKSGSPDQRKGSIEMVSGNVLVVCKTSVQVMYKRLLISVQVMCKRLLMAFK